MTKANATRSFSSVLIRKTLPRQAVIMCGLFLSFLLITFLNSEQEIKANHSQQMLDLELHIERNIASAALQVENLANNDLIINALIDTEKRDTYLPLLLQSFRINNSLLFSIAVVDFSGAVITQRNYSAQLENQYKLAVQASVLEQAQTLRLITGKGLLIAVPIILNKSAEGAIIFHVSNINDILPSFNTDFKIDTYSLDNVKLYQTTDTEHDAQAYQTSTFSHELLTPNWRFVSYQTYRDAYGYLISSFVFMLMVFCLAMVGSYVVTKVAARTSQGILQNLADHLNHWGQNDQRSHIEKPTQQSQEELSTELLDIQDSFESVFNRLTAASSSSDRLSMIFNGIRESVVLLDKHYKTLISNYVFDALAYDTDFDADHVEKILNAILVNSDDKQKNSIELCYQRADNDNDVWVFWYVSAIEHTDGELLYIVVGQDVTARKLAEQELLIKNTAIDKANTSIIIADITAFGQPIIYANRGYTELTQYSEEEVLGNNCNLLQGEETETYQVESIREAIKARENIDITITNYKKDGSSFLNRLLLSPIVSSDGVIKHYLGLQQDVTTEYQAQMYLEKARLKAEESSRLKSDFLASMSHEIRTPINGISGTLQLLENTLLDQRQSKYISLAIQSTDNLLTIINDILDFSKIEAGKLSINNTHFNVDDLFSQSIGAFKALAEKKNLKLLTYIDLNGHHYVNGDAVRIRQILDNLIGNAIKFSENGNVVVSVGWQPDTSGQCTICFRVSDSGIGISDEKLETVFQHFVQEDSSTTRKFGGSGLGLAICKQLCDLMDGEIIVESEKGQGTTFMVCIPTTVVSPNDLVIEEDDQGGLSQEDAQDCTVLIVEDNELNRIIACEQLNAFKLFTAENGQQALKLLNNKHSQIDIILMDCQMPVMDGYECTRKIRAGDATQRYQDIPIIALTANAMKGDKEKCIEAGMSDYLSKPFKAIVLNHKVTEWFEKTRHRSG